MFYSIHKICQQMAIVIQAILTICLENYFIFEKSFKSILNYCKLKK